MDSEQMSDLTPGQDVAIGLVIGAALLALVCFLCRHNPPGETCFKPTEPHYPPVIVGPTPPPDEPPVEPPACRLVPNGPPDFPMCYPFMADSQDYFYMVDAGQYELYPITHYYDTQRTWFLEGWFARHKTESQCSYTTRNPGFDGRFVRAPQGGCGGIH